MLSKILTTPELWGAVQIRKRAKKMAWTPGLMFVYARALSMLADPPPAGWIITIRRALEKIFSLRKQCHDEKVQGRIASGALNEHSNDKGK